MKFAKTEYDGSSPTGFLSPKKRAVIDPDCDSPGGKRSLMTATPDYQHLGTLAEEENKIVETILDDIWDNYNDNMDEILDRKEMEEFIYITLIENGVRKYKNIAELRADEDFRDCFDAFDADGDGDIVRHELFDFIRDHSGLN